MAQERKNGNSDKSMTAVEWLVEQLSSIGIHAGYGLFEQAKQMEKEQIIKAYSTIDKYVWLSTRKEAAEQYYNETYGKAQKETITK